MKMTIEHGGALDRAIARFGGAAKDWLDLSTGINPEHFPLPELTAPLWNRLPDEGLLERVLNAARVYYEADQNAPIVASPGTQALIQLIPTLCAPSTVAILGPTYQEHAAAFSAADWNVVECATLDDIPEDARVVTIVNPNNPDGRIVARPDLLGLARKLGERGGFLVVDEAFADPHPEVSIARHAAHAPLVVLKSFGKFFGLAGVRLGFLLANDDLVKRVADRLGPWAVAGPTLAIALNAFEGGVELEAFHQRIDKRRAELATTLAHCQLIEVGGTALFALVAHENAHGIYDALCERHILVRKFAYAPDWLRIGLAPDQAGLMRLEQALRDILRIRK
ncbi:MULTISPECIES: threonine-phosphate decarboxylase CobD [Ochrobactrum]|uniref:threonine-phosphate decarboxylase n=1 Tax=Ochrobactrum chromiisoli TaxID=2993941 RepID=A0ABT3QQ07_9HYPH|nr:threonine-phosphate decarboxylase CobD [Ochrobactrum chromiisoli]MCX2697689.1 threonine-phosphate decarboxylase CobD [Ochrobactrum chromiisoli]